MSDPVSSLLQRSLVGTSATSKTEQSAKAGKVDKTLSLPTQPQSPTPTVDNVDVNFLDNKTNTIARILENIGGSVSTLRDAQGRINQIVGLLEQAGGIAVRARDTLKASDDRNAIRPKLAELSTRYADVLAKIDAVAAQVSNPPNLLRGEDLETVFDAGARANTITQSIFISSGGLGLYPIDYAEAEAQIADTARATVTNALDEIRLFAQQLNGDMNMLLTRQDFSLNAMQLLSSQGAAPVLGSTSEETANLLALQLRQQLAGGEMSLAGENQRTLLQQF